MTNAPPDLRVRSAGAAGAYAFEPLTEPGRAWVKTFTDKTQGSWDEEGTFWFRDSIASPYAALKGCGLIVVAGVGSTAENDVPWPDDTTQKETDPMSRIPRRRTAPAAGMTTIETHAMQNFARRLHELMTAKGLSQSDLAATIWGRTTDSRGYDVARNRGRISVYLQGKNYPDPANLKALADALGTTPEELAPDIFAAAVDREHPAISITGVASSLDKVHVRVDALLPMAAAAEIASIVAKAGIK